MSQRIEDAAEMAARAHQGQTRWGGEEYITHPEWVADWLIDQGADEDTIVTGWLHDVIEDTECLTVAEAEEVFGHDVAVALDHLTHKEDETYAEYICRLSKNKIAREVKLGDLAHNMSTLDLNRAANRQRKQKYEMAAQYLFLVGAVENPENY